MNEGQQPPKIPTRHYVYLVLWGGSMFVACTPGFGWIWGLLFLFVFFLVTTFKVLKKMLLVFVITAIVGGVLFSVLGELAAAIFVVLPIISILLKINFLRKHWKALRLGFFAYFGYIIIMLVCGTALPMIGMFIGALIFTAIFHKLLLSLYREGYDTDKAFAIVGLTPVIIISFVLPFLKIDIFGMEMFNGVAPDDVSIEIQRDINFTSKVLDQFIEEEDVKVAMQTAVKVAKPDMDINFKLSDGIKLSGFDINDIIDIPKWSHTLEASFAYSAAYGVFKVESYEKDCTIRNGDGTIEIISPVDEVHSIIKDHKGNKIGDIYLDREDGIETVKFSNGFIYSIVQATGEVIDAEGKLLGKIVDGIQGTKILMDTNGSVIRKFKADGLIVDGNDNELGYAAV